MATGGADLLNAVVIGATGATGKCLVGSLLKAKDKVGKVTLLARRKLEGVDQGYGVDIGAEETAGRLMQHVEDLNDISDDTVKQLCTGRHVFFNCLGTSRRQAGSADAFRHIDYEIPIRLIKLAHQAGVPHCSLLTSWGSNPNSWFLYTRTKGELETSVKGLEFTYTSIFRPGVLGRGDSARFGEKIAKLFVTPLPVATLAESMMQDAWNVFSSEGSSAPADKVAIFGNTDIRRLSKEGEGPTATPKPEESGNSKPDEQPAQTNGEQTEQAEEEQTEQPREEQPEQPKAEEEQTKQPREEQPEQPKAEETTEEPKKDDSEVAEQPGELKVEEQPGEEPPKEEQPAQSS